MMALVLIFFGLAYVVCMGLFYIIAALVRLGMLIYRQAVKGRWM